MFKPGDFHKSFPTLTTLIILMSSVCFRTSLSVVLLWMKEHFFFFSPATGSQKKWKILLLLCLDLLLLFWFGLVDCFFCFVVGFFWLVWFLVFVVCWVFLVGWLVFIVGVWVFFWFGLVLFCYFFTGLCGISVTSVLWVLPARTQSMPWAPVQQGMNGWQRLYAKSYSPMSLYSVISHQQACSISSSRVELEVGSPILKYVL